MLMNHATTRHDFTWAARPHSSIPGNLTALLPWFLAGGPKTPPRLATSHPPTYPYSLRPPAHLGLVAATLDVTVLSSIRRLRLKSDTAQERATQSTYGVQGRDPHACTHSGPRGCACWPGQRAQALRPSHQGGMHEHRPSPPLLPSLNVIVFYVLASHSHPPLTRQCLSTCRGQRGQQVNKLPVCELGASCSTQL